MASLWKNASQATLKLVRSSRDVIADAVDAVQPDALVQGANKYVIEPTVNGAKTYGIDGPVQAAGAGTWLNQAAEATGSLTKQASDAAVPMFKQAREAGKDIMGNSPLQMPGKAIQEVGKGTWQGTREHADKLIKQSSKVFKEFTNQKDDDFTKLGEPAAAAESQPGLSIAIPDSEKTDAEVDTLNSAGLAANKIGDTRRAADLFLKASAMRPSAPKYMLSAGNMLLKLGDAVSVTQAIEVYERVQDLHLSEYQAKMASEKKSQAELIQARRAVDCGIATRAEIKMVNTANATEEMAAEKKRRADVQAAKEEALHEAARRKVADACVASAIAKGVQLHASGLPIAAAPTPFGHVEQRASQSGSSSVPAVPASAPVVRRRTAASSAASNDANKRAEAKVAEDAFRAAQEQAAKDEIAAKAARMKARMAALEAASATDPDGDGVVGVAKPASAPAPMQFPEPPQRVGVPSFPEPPQRVPSARSSARSSPRESPRASPPISPRSPPHATLPPPPLPPPRVSREESASMEVEEPSVVIMSSPVALTPEEKALLATNEVGVTAPVDVTPSFAAAKAAAKPIWPPVAPPEVPEGVVDFDARAAPFVAERTPTSPSSVPLSVGELSPEEKVDVRRAAHRGRSTADLRKMFEQRSSELNDLVE